MKAELITKIEERKATLGIVGLGYVGLPLLIVDDVYSTGSSVSAVINQLAKKTRRNLPHDIRIATVWYRPSEKTLRTPDYFVHGTDDWLVLPYELSGFSIEELKVNRPEMAELLDRLAPWAGTRNEWATA